MITFIVMRKKPKQLPSNLDKVVDQVLSGYTGQPVLYFADNHLISDKVLKVAIATAKKLNKPVGLELFKSAHQVAIGHLKNGNLSRDEFVRLGLPRDEKGKPLVGTPEYFMGHNRTKAMLENIADNILDGVCFYPLGSSLGLINPTQELSEAFDHIEFLKLKIQFSIHFSKATQDKIKKNPKLYWERLFNRAPSFDKSVKSSENALTQKQRERLSYAFELVSSQDADYLGSIYRVLEILHPDWNSLEAEESKLERIFSDYLMYEIEKYRDMELAPLRCMIDPHVANKIILSDKFDETGMIVVYGQTHSINFRGRQNADIVTSLNNSGISVLVADTELPQEYLDNVSFSENTLTERVTIPYSLLTPAP